MLTCSVHAATNDYDDTQVTATQSVDKKSSDYVLGEGLQIGNLPMYVGGYLSLDYLHTEQEDRYRIDDIAFISYGNFNKFSYMLEVEFKSLYVKTQSKGQNQVFRDHKLYTERAYIDYAINENYVLRAGKFNSPVGFWNMLPINVLVETTSSPLLTKEIFPKFTSGLDLNYTIFDQKEISLNLIFQSNRSIDDNYNNFHLNKHVGLGVSVEKNDLTLKVNIGQFNKIKPQPQDLLNYVLFGARYEQDKYQILAELSSQFDNKQITKSAAYLQGVYRFTEKHIGILRLEMYDAKLSSQDDEIAILGYTYRPLYPIAIKIEYQLHSQHKSNQLNLSTSILF